MNNSRVTLIVGLLLAVLVGLIIFSGSGWYMSSPPANPVSTTNSDAIESGVGVAHPNDWKLYSNAEIGISFYYPPSWIVSDSETPRAIIIRSPDFEKRVLPSTLVYRFLNPVLRGAQFDVPLDGNELPEDLQSPEAYIAFKMPGAQNSSNRFEAREILFGGQPAILYSHVKYEDHGDLARIQTSYRGRELYVHYIYDAFSPEKEEILNDFISGFQFR